ncbi:sodium:proton antiporter [Cardiobacteriaceae bacterium TAE3-ERU3]|nr:sodium:proton antiporter [Cardiobacteriaceae bacterium TAE3-ERU3]
MTTTISDAVGAKYQRRRMFAGLLLCIGVYVGFSWLSTHHEPGSDWGWYSLLPTLLVIITAIISRRPFESMIAGGVAGLVMLDPGNLISPFAENISSIVGNETIVWVVLVCGLMGGFIRLLEISGCLDGFSGWMQNLIKSRRQSMIATFFIGVAVFIDDYLNCLAVSSSVKKLTDHYHVSREKLAYIVDSTAAPMCIIVPISTWAVYFSGLLEENGMAEKDHGMLLYIQSIPFMAYAWVCLLLVFLVIIGVVGDYGPMKKAEARAKAGQPVPPESIGEGLSADTRARRKVSFRVNMFNFVFPMVLLVASTVYYDIDLLQGVILTCAVTVVLFYVQGLLGFEEQVEAIFDGFKIMLYPLAAVIAGFFIKNINDQLGMTEYVVNSLIPYMNNVTFPAIIFASMALIVFSTGSSWGVFVISIPLVVPIAHELGTHLPLVAGALLSASAFGSHACFFSDSSLLAAKGSGCSPMAHAFSQFPYAVIGAVVTILVFLGLGYMYA